MILRKELRNRSKTAISKFEKMPKMPPKNPASPNTPGESATFPTKDITLAKFNELQKKTGDQITRKSRPERVDRKRDLKTIQSQSIHKMIFKAAELMIR
jgi:hypothetical protein